MRRLAQLCITILLLTQPMVASSQPPNRPLRELAHVKQVQEAHGAQNRTVLNVHEDLSTGAKKQLPLPKRSNDAFYSMLLFDLQTGDVIEEQNATMPMTPASTLKTLTFYLASQRLDSDFAFETKVIQGQDALYIKFAGDPTLQIADLATLLDKAFGHIKSRAVKKIYLDGEDFGLEPNAPGVGVDNLKFAFAAGSTSYILNNGSVTLHKKQPDAHGDSSSTGLKPYYSAKDLYGNLLHISFEGEVLDGTSNPDNCTLELAVTDQNHYRLFGCYHHQSAPSTLNIAISNQKEYAREVVKILARKFSMSKVEFSKSPQSATLIASHRSEPLPALLKKMMVSSDNQIADALVKAMTFKHYNKAASWSMVKRFFSECLPPEISGRHQVVLADGAGLSVQNKITAAFMGDLLKAIYNNPKTLQLFMQSAPHNHKINSPLHERLSGLTHRIYGKTGYINYSSGLIGIVAPPDSPEEARFGFVIYTNNNTGNYRQMKNFEDAWLEEMLSRKIAK